MADVRRAPAESVTAGRGEPVKYRVLKRRHPDYDPDRWRLLRALYKGGRKLFDDEVLREVFPKHGAEHEEIYTERCRRAYYANYAGPLINYLVAGLFSDPLLVKREPETVEADFYKEFLDDCSPPAGLRMPFSVLMRRQVLDAMVVGWAWTQVDLPDVGPDFEAYTLAEEEQAGARDAYALPVDAECVVNWKMGKDGRLAWLVTLDVTRPQPTFDAPAVWIRETYHLYTPEGWTRYVVEYTDPKASNEERSGITVKERPTDDQVIGPDAGGPHSFGCVPFERLELPEALRAMDQIESMVREHFNKGNALSWAQYRALFSQLYEFLAPELPGIDEPVGGRREDAGRARRQPRGVGYIQERDRDDTAEFIGPDTTAFDHAMNWLGTVRDEIHRVLFAMALASDNSAGVVKRTAESKQLDKAPTAVILEEIGRYVRDHALGVMMLVSTGRADAVEHTVNGMEKFDDLALADQIEQAIQVDTVRIPSPTFHRKLKGAIARRMIGDQATPEELKTIEKEIEDNVTAEEFMAPDPEDHLDDPNAPPVPGRKPGRVPPRKTNIAGA